MAHSQFARDTILTGNDDGQGLRRYELCRDIIHFFDRQDPDDFHNRIEPGLSRLYENKIAIKYNQNAKDFYSPWIWNDEFYCAPVKDLQYIRRLLYENSSDK